MFASVIGLVAVAVLVASPLHAQGRGQALPPLPAGQTNDPFPAPIRATEGAIRVNVAEFASLPDIGGVAARMMNLVDEPGTRRLFVNDMRGPLYVVSYDGKSVGMYLDINAQTWGHPVQSAGRERGFQSFAFHPQFGQAGTPGFGKFYTYFDTSNMTPTPDFLPSGGSNTHDTVVLEWTAKTPSAATYDGGPPRELFRLAPAVSEPQRRPHGVQPERGAPDSPEFGLLYIAIADGGSGGDPFKHAQNMGSAFGKLFRIDPLGTNSRNKKYGVPAEQPLRDDARRAAGDLRAWHPQRATLRLGSEERQPVPRRHRPEHRRGDQPRHGPEPILAGTPGKAATAS